MSRGTLFQTTGNESARFVGEAASSPAGYGQPSEARRIIDAFGPSIGHALHPFAAVVLDATARIAPLRPNVTMVARSLRRSTRTLEREFAAHELPPPHRLVVLARWLEVAQSLNPVQARTRATARAFGFSSTQDFCRASWRETHMSARILRTNAGIHKLVREVLLTYGQRVDDDVGREMATFRRDLATARRLPHSHSDDMHRADACVSAATAGAVDLPGPPT